MFPCILYVEDNKDTARYLKELLTREGYDLWTVGTVSKGLEFARSEAFVLFLIDNGLPDGTGLALCRMIRDFNKHTPILFYSASYDPALRQLALSAGAQGYVNKRAGFDILKATIEALVGNCSGMTESQAEIGQESKQDSEVDSNLIFGGLP